MFTVKCMTFSMIDSAAGMRACPWPTSTTSWLMRLTTVSRLKLSKTTWPGFLDGLASVYALEHPSP